MIELFALFLMGSVLFVGIALVVGLIKLTFKLLLLPFVLLGWLAKGLLLLLVLPLALAVAVPILIVVGVVLIPLLLLGLAILALVALLS